MVRTVMYFAHANHQLEFDDLYDVGLDAVFESIEKFDPARSRFSSFVAVVVNRRLIDFASKRATYCRRSRRYALKYREGRRDGTQPEFSSFMNDVFLSLTPLEQTAVRMKFGLKGEAQIREALAATTGKQVVVRHLLNKAIKRLRGVKRLREAYAELVT